MPELQSKKAPHLGKLCWTFLGQSHCSKVLEIFQYCAWNQKLYHILILEQEHSLLLFVKVLVWNFSSACKTLRPHFLLQSLHPLTFNSAVVVQIKYFSNRPQRACTSITQSCCIWSDVSVLVQCYNNASLESVQICKIHGLDCITKNPQKTPQKTSQSQTL